MKNSENKAKQLLNVIMNDKLCEFAQVDAVFNLLSILEPADFVECGYAYELRSCLAAYGNSMDDKMREAIIQALKTN